MKKSKRESDKRIVLGLISLFIYYWIILVPLVHFFIEPYNKAGLTPYEQGRYVEHQLWLATGGKLPFILLFVVGAYFAIFKLLLILSGFIERKIKDKS